MRITKIDNVASVPIWFAVLATTCSCFGASERRNPNVERVESAEYNFSVAFPKGLRVCPSMSGDQVHGFVVRIGSTSSDCTKSRDADATISVYAYSNATFEMTPEQELSGLCRPDTGDVNGDLAALAFPGFRSARCHAQNADGSTNVYVVTQAGRWPGMGNSPESGAPYINYTAALHTFDNRITRDLDLFRKVLGSVQIGYEK